ncbi:MAG: hypothetical protein EBU08_08595 [Micrococcales bacterium]|nr:hypothetical protein [Micrococcales bacterium]
MSVEDATILPTTTKGNEMNGMTETNLPLSDAERYNPNQLVTYKKIAGTFAAPEAPEYITEKVVDIEWALDQARKQSADYYSLKNKIDGLNDKIVEWANPNYSKEEVIRELCEYFGINPTKQVRVTGTIQFEAIVDIPLDEVEDFDAHYLLADDLSLTSYNSNVDINDWSLEDTDVDWD